jgi:L-threonylcarbamoyladenylate synthase
MGLLVYPTDTVWGVGGDIYQRSDYEQIAALKNSDATKPLSILFNNVGQLLNYFNLWLDYDWLTSFFALQSTLLIPSHQLKDGIKNLPQNPVYWGVRVLPLFDRLITTTSLNLTGSAAIFCYEDALRFCNTYGHLYDLELRNFNIRPSGHSSTIVTADTLRVLRKGFLFDEVNKLIATCRFRGE